MAYVDLSTFTASEVTLTTTRATNSGTEPAYAYKDYGSDHFSTFTHKFTYYKTYASGSSSATAALLYGLGDITQANYDSLNTADKGLCFGQRYSGGQWSIVIVNFNGDGEDSSIDAQVIATGSALYVTVVKNSTTVTTYIYSDSDRTVLEDSISISCTDSFRYLSAYGAPSSAPFYYTGYTEYFDLGEPSSSPSASISSSPSASPSSSPSTSPSGTGEDYTRGDYVSLPATDANLETEYSAQDYIDVENVDTDWVGQTAAEQYAVHQYKNVVNSTNCVVTWTGKTDKSPSSATVYLQIYNINTSLWETLDSDNSSPADVDFVLTASISDLTNYKDGSDIITCRIYQSM